MLYRGKYFAVVLFQFFRKNLLKLRPGLENWVVGRFLRSARILKGNGLNFSKREKNPDFGHSEADSGLSTCSRTLKKSKKSCFCPIRSRSGNGLRVVKIGIFFAFRKIHIISFRNPCWPPKSAQNSIFQPRPKLEQILAILKIDPYKKRSGMENNFPKLPNLLKLRPGLENWVLGRFWRSARILKGNYLNFSKIE